MTREPAPGVALIEPVGGHGGMDYYDSGLAGALSAGGCRCVWYSCDGTAVRGARPVELKRTFVGIWGSAPAPWRALRYVRGLLASLRDARRQSLAVAHLHFFQAGPLEWLTVLLVRIAGLACVATAHDVESFAADAAGSPEPSVPSAPPGSAISLRSGPSVEARDPAGGRRSWWPALVYRRCARLIVHNQVSAAALNERVPRLAGRVHVVPHGSYVGLVAPRLPQAQARQALGLPAVGAVALFFGQIKVVKGLDLLIDAVAVLREALPLTLVVAGKVWKDDLERYRRQIDAAGLHERVRLHVRYIPDGELAAYYGAADVVVLPYRRIYQSGVLLMAMSMGVPVLASDLAGMREVVDDGRNGFLFRSGDAQDLARVLARVLGDDGARARVAAAALQDMQARFDWDAAAVQAQEVYRLALAGRREGGGAAAP